MDSIRPVKIGKRTIGPGYPLFIMADVGLTNGGDLDRTLQLIEIAKRCGVDALKFQMIGPEHLLGDKEISYTYPTIKHGLITENMFEMFSALNFDPGQWKQIAEAVQNAGLEFICTSHYLGAVDILEEIGVSCHKICSWSVTHKRLIEKIGKTGKPMLMDLGTSTEYSLSELTEWYLRSGGTRIIPLHDFHTDNIDEMNFYNIKKLMSIYNSPVGYTAPDQSSHHDFMAIGLGINVIEKRLTHDKAVPKNGHWKAMEPDEFRAWVDIVRELERSLGSKCIRPSQKDLETSAWAFKSLFTVKEIQQGCIIQDDMIDAKRPGTGISASKIDDIVGRRAKCDITNETMLRWEMID